MLQSEKENSYKQETEGARDSQRQQNRGGGGVVGVKQKGRELDVRAKVDRERP